MDMDIDVNLFWKLLAVPLATALVGGLLAYLQGRRPAARRKHLMERFKANLELIQTIEDFKKYDKSGNLIVGISEVQRQSEVYVNHYADLIVENKDFSWSQPQTQIDSANWKLYFLLYPYRGFFEMIFRFVGIVFSLFSLIGLIGMSFDKSVQPGGEEWPSVFIGLIVAAFFPTAIVYGFLVSLERKRRSRVDI